MSIRNRLKKLEGAFGDECPECEFTSWDKTRFKVITREADEEPRESEFCDLCGRPTRIVLSFGEGVHS